MGSHKNVKLLYWINFFIDFVPYKVVAIIYFTKVTGSFTLGMSIFSVAMLSAAIFQIPTGLFSDKFGRKKTVMAGALAGIFSTLFYAIGYSHFVLVIGSIFAGLARAFYSGNNDALLYETLAESQNNNEYHHHLGRTSSMFQIALVISAVLGGMLASWSFAVVMWVSIIPQFGTLILSLCLKETKNLTEHQNNPFLILIESLKQFIKNKNLRLMTYASMISYGVGEPSYYFRTTFINSLWPLWAICIPNILSNIGGALSFYFSGKVLNKVKPLKALEFQTISNRIINIIAYIYPTIFSPLILSASSFTYGIGSVAENMLFQKEFTDKERATLSSLNSLIGNIMFAVAGIIMGVVADKIGPAKTLLLTQIFLAIPLYFYWKIYKNLPISNGRFK